MSKKVQSDAERKRETMEKSLTQMGQLIYDQIQNREFPWIKERCSQLYCR